MNIYLGNKMVGMKQFNYPWFDEAERNLRGLLGPGTVIFNPANHDREKGFHPPPDSEGTMEEMQATGFSRRDALAADYAWITANSDAMIIGPEWAYSIGTISEIAVHQALHLPVWEYAVYLHHYHKEDLMEWMLPPIMGLGGSNG